MRLAGAVIKARFKETRALSLYQMERERERAKYRDIESERERGKKTAVQS